MSRAHTNLVLSDTGEPVLISAKWASGREGTYVVLDIDAITLYIEPAQLERLLGELSRLRAEQPAVQP